MNKIDDSTVLKIHNQKTKRKSITKPVENKRITSIKQENQKLVVSPVNNNSSKDFSTPKKKVRFKEETPVVPPSPPVQLIEILLDEKEKRFWKSFYSMQYTLLSLIQQYPSSVQSPLPNQRKVSLNTSL